VATLILAATITGSAAAPLSAQSPIDVYELIDYRLRALVFDWFVQANGRVVEITRHDSVFTYAPLVTKEVALSGGAVTQAAGPMARLLKPRRADCRARRGIPGTAAVIESLIRSKH